MQDGRFDGGEPHDVNERMAGDFAALRDATSGGLPRLETTVRALEASRRKEGVLSTMRGSMQRPWGIALATTAVVAIALVFVPLPYSVQRGHEVELQLPAGTSQADVEVAANSVRAALDVTGGMAVELGSEPRVRARVAAGADVQQAVAAVAGTLAQRGIAVQTHIGPWRERISGNVYAMAMNRMQDVTVPVDGRSTAEIEADVRAKLEAAGITNPQVTVTRDGDSIAIDVQAQSTGADGEQKVQLKIERQGGAGEDLQFNVLDREALRGLSDADKKAEIERQLRERGIDATVTVEDGKVQVEARKEVQK